MEKQWSLESVARAHGYHQVNKNNVAHKIFADWVDNRFIFPQTIIDIGGGNGNVLEFLALNRINTYTCIDINETCLEVGRMAYNMYSNINFMFHDIVFQIN